MNFRLDINGLRAIAVIVVVLFHFNVSLMSGGFAGVDVFFVISGFLMTGIIFRGLEKDTFSIIKFYIARANRIIPALAVLCLFLILYSWFFILDVSFKKTSEHIISSLLFLSNITYWMESDYFDASAHSKWLLHTWSLSAEWQFYIIYPLVLSFLSKLISVKNIKKVIVLGCIVGFAGNVVVSLNLPSAAYYLLPTRAWEMLLGGIAYLYPIKIKDNIKKYTELIGIFLIVLSCVFIDKSNAWPGYLALIPVFGAYLVIVSNRQDSVLTNNVLFQYIGKWSYSIYLWHWPLVVYMYNFSGVTVTNTIILMAASIIFGALSYELIEKNAKGKWPALMSVLVFSFSVGVFVKDGYFEQRALSNDSRNQFLEKYNDYTMDSSGLWLACDALTQYNKQGFLNIPDRCISAEPDGLFVWGDSHIGSLSTGLRHELPSHIPFSQLASSGCAPSFTNKRSSTSKSAQTCNYSNSMAREALLKAKPRTVILGVSNRHEQYDLEYTINELYQLGVKNVVVMGPFPQWKPSLVPIYVTRHFGEEYISDIQFDSKILRSNEHMVNLNKENNNFTYINVLSELCDDLTVEKPKCRVMTEGNLMTFDYGHLTEEGSIYISKNYVLPHLKWSK